MEDRGRRPSGLRHAPVTCTILALNVAVWAGMVLAGSVVSNRMIVELGAIPARLTGVLFEPDAWLPPAVTLVSAMFLHGGWAHLLMNALFLIVVAPPVESLFSARRFTTLYVVGGIAGNIAQTLADPASLAPVIGASGAISAVFGAYLMRFADRPTPARAGAASEFVAAARFAVAWAALQALVAIAVPDLGIAVWAHIGGLVIGLLIAAFPDRKMTGI